MACPGQYGISSSISSVARDKKLPSWLRLFSAPSAFAILFSSSLSFARCLFRILQWFVICTLASQTFCLCNPFLIIIVFCEMSFTYSSMVCHPYSGQSTSWLDLSVFQHFNTFIMAFLVAVLGKCFCKCFESLSLSHLRLFLPKLIGASLSEPHH